MMYREKICGKAWFALTGGLALLFAIESGLRANEHRSGELKPGQGLIAHYYKDNKHWNGYWPEGESKPKGNPAKFTFTRYAYTRKEPLINHLFIHRGWFSVRWEGWLDVPSPEKQKASDINNVQVNFYIWADDGCRLRIDGKIVIDSWSAAWEKDLESHRMGSLQLTPGKHRIVVEYFQGPSLKRDDHDPMKLYWEIPACKIKKQLIPASHFSHDLENYIPRKH